MRFGLDALLLACFAAREFGASPHFGLKNPCRGTPWLPLGPGFAAIDLGCGQGASTAALLLRSENMRALGVDFSPALIEAARKNISLLNLTGRAAFRVLDLSRAGAPFPAPCLISRFPIPRTGKEGREEPLATASMTQPAAGKAPFRSSYAPRDRSWFITASSTLSFRPPVSPLSQKPWAPAASASAKPSPCAPERRTRQSASLWKPQRTARTISAFSLISCSRKRTAVPRRRRLPSALFWINQPGKASSKSPSPRRIHPHPHTQILRNFPASFPAHRLRDAAFSWQRSPLSQHAARSVLTDWAPEHYISVHTANLCRVRPEHGIIPVQAAVKILTYPAKGLPPL